MQKVHILVKAPYSKLYLMTLGMLLQSLQPFNLGYLSLFRRDRELFNR